MKKTRLQKSHATVPLKAFSFSSEEFPSLPTTLPLTYQKLGILITRNPEMTSFRFYKRLDLSLPPPPPSFLTLIMTNLKNHTSLLAGR